MIVANYMGTAKTRFFEVPPCEADLGKISTALEQCHGKS